MDEPEEPGRSIIEARRNILEKLYQLGMRGNVPAAGQFLDRTARYQTSEPDPPEIYEEETDE